MIKNVNVEKKDACSLSETTRLCLPPFKLWGTVEDNVKICGLEWIKTDKPWQAYTPSTYLEYKIHNKSGGAVQKLAVDELSESSVFSRVCGFIIFFPKLLISEVDNKITTRGTRLNSVVQKDELPVSREIVSAWFTWVKLFPRSVTAYESPLWRAMAAAAAAVWRSLSYITLLIWVASRLLLIKTTSHPAI